MNTQSNQSNNEIKMLHEVIADYKLQNEKLIEDNKELKEENEELKYEKKIDIEQIKNYDKQVGEWCSMNYKLQEENYKLKEENEELKAALVDSVVENDELPEHALMIDKLNEEFSVAQDTIIKGEKLLLLQREISKGLECAFQDLLIAHIASCECFPEEELILNGGRINYQHLVKNILDRMNDDDWNEDGGRCVLEISTLNFHYTHLQSQFMITTRCNYSDSDEED
tara:strand:- start:319 stop:996 length:678 start_codon:yes stop_codon:yes gene_type:complete